MFKKVVSVIVPIYNIERYINRCIDSILDQTYTLLEIILVDDGSTDNCSQICDDYAKKDQRIIVIHKKNSGLSDARNSGIEVAHGDYLMFVDGDDWIRKDMISLLIRSVQKNNVKLGMCGYYKVNESDSLLQEEILEPAVWSEIQFWEYYYGGFYRKTKIESKTVSCVTAWGKLYKRELFNYVRYTSGKHHEDEIILHEIISQCDRISVIGEPLYYYCSRDGSIMSRLTLDDCLDKEEGKLHRTRYFIRTGKIDIAVTSWFDGLSLRFRNKTKKIKSQKKRSDYLLKQYRKQYLQLVKSGAGLVFTLNGFTYLFGKKIYWLAHPHRYLGFKRSLKKNE